MIVVATSNKIVLFDHAEAPPQVLLKRHPGLRFFQKEAMGFFGVAYCPKRHLIFAPKRARFWSTPKANKPSSDARLYAIDINTFDVKSYARIKDIHDVHQVLVYGDCLYLTDTGKNRVCLFDLNRRQVERYILVGDKREDVDHLNALAIQGGCLWINANRLGKKASRRLCIPLEELHQTRGRDFYTKDAHWVADDDHAEHTHDLEFNQDGLHYCVSQQGLVRREGRQKPLVDENLWARGLAVTEQHLWVGLSQMAPRGKRHAQDLDGFVHLYDRDGKKFYRQITIPGAGQVNDILNI